ncbi:MAG: hypothetical protein AAF328_06530 [Planctomycetota bacterium]
MNRSGLHHVKIEAVDWCAVLPVLRIFQLARTALQPTKLALAWLLVAAVYLGGMVMAWPLDPTRFELVTEGRDWEQSVAVAGEAEILDRSSERMTVLAEGSDVLRVWIGQQFDSLWRLADAVVSLDVGLSGGGVIGALGALLIEGPRSLWRVAPGFVLAFAGWAFVVATLLGLGIARLAALELARRRTAGPVEAIGFIFRKGVWTLLAPALPLLVVASGAVVLVAVGFALFNLPIVEWIGGLAYGPLLLVGLAMALLLIVLAVALHLLVAAMAVEGTDAFDAVSRCFSYVTTRPWQVLGYAAAALAYGALTFLVVLSVVGLAIWLTDRFLAVGILGEATGDGNDLVVAVVGLWQQALLAVPAAYAVSFYFCASVQTYLLVRQSADGSGLDDAYDPTAAKNTHAVLAPPEAAETQTDEPRA